ncbi:RNA methyltransferase [Pelistega europaea]|uniref:tRNA (cytidine/uridine-2'-O-)-methyltransferase TrmJ n=1 Tax=Pelistega europaea TaxID=106147 RepID=A0A7Y4LBL7_9BURK|nr:RNA methyltransferase [Pelistega europaea]NOL49447.1 RNA methyltransferase [Pelistega europaea]
MTKQDFFSRTRFIMVGTSHPGNVGSAARAIKTMGFKELVLAAPQKENMLSHPEALALASGAVDILENAQVVESLEQALAPVTLSFALTARTRDMGPPVVDIRQAAEEAHQHLLSTPYAQIAIILGPERIGLDNAQISHCHRICHIPANPEYSSLNVAQALQLAAWELRYAFMKEQEAVEGENRLLEGQASKQKHYASQDKVEALLTHWEQALIHIDFLNPAHPKKLMPRMRYWFNRSQLTQEEVDMMRGVCTQILKR